MLQAKPQINKADVKQRETTLLVSFWKYFGCQFSFLGNIQPY